MSNNPGQDAVIYAPVDDDLLVVAGAGSGKTTTMTNRIVQLLEYGVSPEHILGITFTRKAAAELLDRVTKKLLERTASNTKPEGIERYGSLTRFVLRPQISTYDAFFQSIVRKYGLLVGVDPNTAPLSGASAALLIDSIVNADISLAYKAGFSSLDKVKKDTKSLHDSIANSMISASCSDMNTAIERIHQWNMKFLQILDSLLENVDVPQDNPKLGNFPKQGRYSQKVYEEIVAQWYKKAELQRIYNVATLKITVVQREALLEYVRRFVALKKERGVAEFSDFTIAALQIVTRFPSVRDQYCQQYSHVLLDEYQDTSTTQATVLTTLFHDSNNKSALTAVGDPFQAIYAWRGASPGALRMLKEKIAAGEEPISIKKTYRNDTKVLKVANMVTGILRNAYGTPSSALLHDVPVQKLEAAKKDEGTVLTAECDNILHEAHVVARFAKRAVEKYGVEAKEHNEIPVAVLFRNKKRMPLYRQILQSYGLSVAVNNVDDFLSRPQVRDVITLLKASSNHENVNDLVALLSSARFALSAKDLKTIARAGDDLNTARRFNALVQVGIVSADTPKSEWKALVREHMEQVPNIAFLSDIFDDQHTMDNLQKKLSTDAVRALNQVASMVAQVRAASHRSLMDVVHTAFEALQIDIDMMVSASLAEQSPTTSQLGKQTGSDERALRAHQEYLDMVAVFESQVQTFLNEQTQTYAGLPQFLTWLDYVKTLETQEIPDTSLADVTMMTIHKAKGLQWDAVAIVDVDESTFPVKKQSGLSISQLPNEKGVIAYTQEATSWLTDPTLVPETIRADKDMLPLFPHYARNIDPYDALDRIHSIDELDEEIFGTLRKVGALADGSSNENAGSFLTQKEETGKRLHDDERRLMYVALTRAKHEVLTTYAITSAEDEETEGKQSRKPSVFFQEVDNFIREEEAAVNLQNLQDAYPQVLFRGQGAAVGKDAQNWLELLLREESVSESMTDEAATSSETGSDTDTDSKSGNSDISSTRKKTLAWPVMSSEGILRSLSDSVQAVRYVSEHLGLLSYKEGEDTQQNNKKPSMLRDYVVILDKNHDLVQDPLTVEENTLNKRVEQSARQLFSQGRHSVTTVQAFQSDLSDKKKIERLRSIVRPLPRAVSVSAASGTIFHDWAYQYLVSSGTVLNADELMVESRVSLREQAREWSLSENTQDRQLALWAERFMLSPWQQRKALWAEQQIVAAVQGRILNGKIDAVFAGSLDADSKHDTRYTIVDWKTGSRPLTQKEQSEKLIQLDFYRLLFSSYTQISLESIDATLYYLSEPDEKLRYLKAQPKDEDTILAQLTENIGRLSNDEE